MIAADWNGIAAVLAATALVMGSVTTFYQVWVNARRDRLAAGKAEDDRRVILAKVGEVHDEVRTGNGQTIGMLADISEGRAAQAIPESDRTVAEQHHADMKTEADASGAPMHD